MQGISSVAHKHKLNLVLSTSNSFEQEDEECLNLLRQRRVDGVILLASHRNGQLIPRLTQANFNNTILGTYVQPGLTSVCVPIYELGQISVQMLTAQIYGSGTYPDHQMLPAHLVVRDSA